MMKTKQKKIMMMMMILMTMVVLVPVVMIMMLLLLMMMMTTITMMIMMMVTKVLRGMMIHQDRRERCSTDKEATGFTQITELNPKRWQPSAKFDKKNWC